MSNKKSRQSRGFTMVEIALSLAVVAFAMVAIMGVMPTGMTVQKDNREDTIINQEGRYWIEAIRMGGRGMNHLTNYVEEIKLIQTSAKGTRTVIVPLEMFYPGNNGTPRSTNNILTYLTRLRVEPDPNQANAFLTNRIVARVRPMTGAATEQALLTNDVTFRYEIQVDLMPDFGNPTLGDAAAYLPQSLHDVRLHIRYPLFERGTQWVAGNGRRTFRAKIAGTLVPVVADAPFTENDIFYYIEPNRFTAASINVGQ